jgi:hypothetical protein
LGRKTVTFETETGEIVEPDSSSQRFLKTERFAKKKTEVWRHVYQYKLFTAAEERVINRLADFLQLNTNAIVNPNGSVMTVEDMARAIHIDRKDLRTYLRILVRKNALGIWKSGYDETYFMNPYLYEKGNVDRWLYARFEDEFSSKQMKEVGQRMFAGKTKTSLIQVSSF